MEEFKRQATIMKKESKVPGDNLHTCRQCLYRTKSIFVMVNHVREHRQVKPDRKLFNCEKSNLEMYKCNVCNFQTNLLVNFDEHVRTTHISNVKIEIGENSKQINPSTCPTDMLKCHSCRTCGFETFSCSVLTKHIDICAKNNEISINKTDFHRTEYSYKTNQTISRLISKKQCNKHSLIDDINCFKCDNCSYEAKFNVSLKTHKLLHAESREIEWFECEQCPYKIKWRSCLKRHILAKHGVNIKWFQCEKCSYNAEQETHLRDHILMNHESDIEWFKCEQCSYRTMLKSSLKMHIIIGHRLYKY